MSTGILASVLAPFPALRDRLLGEPPAPWRPQQPLPAPGPRPEFWATAHITHPMADSRRADWERTLAPMRGAVHEVLEIGSYEGQSALFWRNFFGAEVTCIDPWQDVAPGSDTAEQIEHNFNRNCPWAHKLKSRSVVALALQMVRGTFDLIYIDGDHSRLAVMADSVLAWPLLRPGGVMIWDDYSAYGQDLPAAERPEGAVKAFRAMMADEIGETFSTGQQFFVWKRKP